MTALEYVRAELNLAIEAAMRGFFGPLLVEVGQELGTVQALLGGDASRHRYCCALAKGANDCLEQLHRAGHLASYNATGCTFRPGPYGMLAPGSPTLRLSYRLAG